MFQITEPLMAICTTTSFTDIRGFHNRTIRTMQSVISGTLDFHPVYRKPDIRTWPTSYVKYRHSYISKKQSHFKIGISTECNQETTLEAN